MENQKKLGQLLPEVQKLMQLSIQSATTRDCSEISVYKDSIANRDQIKSEVKKLAAAFPEVTNDFIILLTDRISDNDFTSQRLKDSINHIIDNSPYKRPSIADIISFDRKIKLYTYSEISAKCYPCYSAFEHFERIEIDGRKRFIEK